MRLQVRRGSQYIRKLFLVNFQLADIYKLLAKPLPISSTTTFESIVAKEQIAQNKQFLLLPQCFQLYSIIILSLTDIFLFWQDVFKVFCCRFVVHGKRLRELYITVYKSLNVPSKYNFILL